MHNLFRAESKSMHDLFRAESKSVKSTYCAAPYTWLLLRINDKGSLLNLTFLYYFCSSNSYLKKRAV